MKETRLRLPAFLVGLIFTALFCALTPFNNIKLQNTPLAGGHFPLASFAALGFVLLVINPAMSSIRKSWRFRFHEILLIWSMVAVSGGIAYTGLLRTFIINITTPERFATKANNIGGRLLALLPAELFPKSPEVVKTLYIGIEGGIDLSWWRIMSRIPWMVWALPMLWWALFILLVYMAMMGMVGLFSHQWIENEKMNFPLLRVPEILSEESDKGTLWQSVAGGFFLVGISIPLILHTFNGLHTYFPQIPQLPTVIPAQPYIPKGGLLSGFYKMKFYIFPAFIGFAFLTPKQISFSLWSFFIAGGLLPGTLQALGRHLPAAALGTTFGPVISRVEEMQMLGAFGVFFFFIIWLARNHLRLVVLSVFRRNSTSAGDYHGILPPRLSLYLFLGGFIGAAGWLSFFGMTLLSAVLFLIVCFMLQLVASKLVCQGGLPYFTLSVAPSDGFLAFFDSRLIAPAGLYMGVIIQKATFLDMRESLMPSLFHSSRLSDGSSPRTRFFWGIASAIILGLVITFIAMLILYYKYGIATMPDEWALETTRRVHENAAQLINYPEAPKAWSITFTIVGSVVMSLLVLGYHHFIWWPLHPIGYLTTYSSAMQILWFSFFIGWLFNSHVIRYGGVKLYKQVRRLFIGLVVGDMLMAVFWLIVGMFSRISYHALPL
ncbi:MAG: DUF6785 family protein [Syntrophobacteraceae bacterium]